MSPNSPAKSNFAGSAKRHSAERTDLVTRMAHRIVQLNEELRNAREELARYSESLVAIQHSILPHKLPEVPGLDLAVHFREAERVGGDFYDVRPIGPHHWAMVTADVCGHGLAAAAILALVHALGSAVQAQASPGSALASINIPLATRYLVDTGQFVTVFVGVYDDQAQMLTYASAGHPPPRLVRGDSVQRLDGISGTPLGIDSKCVYAEKSVQLLPGDRLVLFTDGIIETTNPARELYGPERLDSAVRVPSRSAAELLDHVVSSIRTFRAGQPANDDETCLVAVVNPLK